MATKSDLLGSFGSLLDTLGRRLDPFQPIDVFDAWQGTMNRAAGLARDAGRWQRLAAESSDYDRVIVALDSATRGLVMADSSAAQSVLAALRQVDSALDDVTALFEDR